jgi:ABC-2 type transport system permease protein
MYPVKLLPDALKLVSKINPLTYGVDALKHMITPLKEGPMSPDFSLALDLGVVAALSVVFVLVSARLFERKG